MSTYKADMRFEAEVRWVAEAVWGLESGDCQPGHYPEDPSVREVDGIARLRDITHILMVTTSTKLDKAKSDVKKLLAAEKKELQSVSAVSKWLVTQKQLDAQHLEYARKNNVVVLTLEQFKQRFFDGRSYLNKRSVAPFGSARNPLDNSVEISEDAYVPLPMAVVDKVKRGRDQEGFEERLSRVDVAGLCKLVEKGCVVILMAPFGAGKSLTTREVYKHLSSRYRESYGKLVPICLNLREHWGQEYFDEILERHARSIGFQPKEDLVVAWRSGLSCMLLDGFDELASQTIVRENDVDFMREARRRALSGVRDFFVKLPSDVGGFICGRDHYFDTEAELIHALGVEGKNYKIVRLDEFTEAGANEFIGKYGYDPALPEWLPRKPLILSYLIQENLLGEIVGIDSSQGYGYAWDTFIEKISQRESQLERAVMDANTLRNVMERLAYYVRSLTAGDGPVSGNDLAAIYSMETGQPAGEGVLAQLQRLPCLTQRNQESGLRSFVDFDMLSALQGGALARVIWGQFAIGDKPPLSFVSEKAVDVAVFLLRRGGATSSTPFSIVERLSKEKLTQGDSQLMADCLSVSIAMAKEERKEIDCRGLMIESASFGRLDLEEVRVLNVSFVNCVVDEVIVGEKEPSDDCVLKGCIVNRVRGVANVAGLPGYIFDTSCEVGEFDDMGTNNAIMKSDLDPKVKALITILRKLYCQSGAGRKLSALSRGITNDEVAGYIPEVLQVMERHGFMRTYNKIVHPIRKKSSRVEAILNAPSISVDELVKEVKGL